MNADDFSSRGRAGDQTNVALRNPELAREQLQQRRIGASIAGRRVQLDADHIIGLADDFIPARPGRHL